MKTPSFRYMGGKSRLRKWLVEHFPKEGNTYVEPFVGRGNVFYWARQVLKFSTWHLNDIDTAFFRALLEVDLATLPESVDRESFKNFKNNRDAVSIVIEPRITFAGKGYEAGFDASTGRHAPYTGKCYREVCGNARQLLEGVKITELDWEAALSGYGEGDFVYLDPPYITGKTPYPGIKHGKLVEILNDAPFKWALSGYTSELYTEKLKFERMVIRERNSEIKGSNSRSYEPVNEHLWMNYKDS